MSFKNHFINAYELAERERKKEKEKNAEKFRIAATKEFERLFKIPVTSSKTIGECNAELMIDDVTIIAQESFPGIKFFTMKQCAECGTMFLPVHRECCTSIEDIGRDLSTQTMCCKCELLNKRKNETSEETVIRKLREIFEIIQH